MHNKPSLFLTTNKIMQGPKYKYQKILSSEFGTKPINIDLNINSFQLKKKPSKLIKKNMKDINFNI